MLPVGGVCLLAHIPYFSHTTSIEVGEHDYFLSKNRNSCYESGFPGESKSEAWCRRFLGPGLPSRTHLQGSEENWAGGKRTATITTGPRLTQGGLLGLWWPIRVAVSCSPMLAATGREPPLGRGLSSGLEGCLYTRWFMGKDVEETRQCLILQRRANDYFRSYREFWKTHYCLHLTPTT